MSDNFINKKNSLEKYLKMAEEICQKKTVRFTKSRRQILQMIYASPNPAKAYDILDQLKKTQPQAKPPTVYRALDFLLENGLIHKVNSLNAYVGCSHPLKHNNCYFLICSNCQEISECCTDILTAEIVKIAKSAKFNIQNINLEIEGKCHKCQS